MRHLRLGIVLCVITALPALVPAQSGAERFWIGGRYDGERIIVYFDAVNLGAPQPAGATRIPYPVADAFFIPMVLPEGFVAGLQNGPSAEHFKVGDRYDLLLNRGGVQTFTLTTLVGFQNDERVGNDSYIGALGTMDRDGGLLFQGDYFVVRRHVESSSTRSPVLKAALVPAAVPFDVQSEIARLMTERMKADSRLAPTEAAATLKPAFIVEPFTLADGSVRYYVRAEWRTGADSGYNLMHSFAAWVSPQPTLRILATDRLSFASDANIEQKLLAVAELGSGRTGIVVSTFGGDARSMRLLEYRDGLNISQMNRLQSISSAE